MKIAILGTSGSGKSTLAKQLGEQCGAPVLHLDAVHFLPGWVERPPEEEKTILSRFLDEHDSGSSTAITPETAMPGGWRKLTRSLYSGLIGLSACSGC